MILTDESVKWEWQQFSSEILHQGQGLNLKNRNSMMAGNNNVTFKFEIKLWKPFHFNENIGWNWHKSWNIPEIECKLHIVDDNNYEILNGLNIQANLYIVKTNYETMKLQSVGCRGDQEVVFRNGVALLKQLKFNTTSYKNEYQKFQLIVVISQIIHNQQIILDAKCSPYIFVDSRKHARMPSLNNSLQLTIDPFLPENLDREFVKKERKNCPKQLLLIDNSIKGLINYFTAPNIRHKIKHPLFLAMKFDNCVKLYIRNPITESSSIKLIEQVQSILMSQDKNSLGIQKEIALFFDVDQTDQQEFKKVLEILQLFENDYFALFTKHELIPEDLKQISNINLMRQLYKQIYPNLINQRFGGKLKLDNKEESISLKFISKKQDLQDLDNQVKTQTSLSIQQQHQQIKQDSNFNEYQPQNFNDYQFLMNQHNSWNAWQQQMQQMYYQSCTSQKYNLTPWNLQSNYQYQYWNQY